MAVGKGVGTGVFVGLGTGVAVGAKVGDTGVSNGAAVLVGVMGGGTKLSSSPPFAGTKNSSRAASKPAEARTPV